MQLHVGTSGFSYPEWKGSFYPADLPRYVRLRGTSYERADRADWVRRLRAPGWDRAFVFFKHEEAGREPIAARPAAQRDAV